MNKLLATLIAGAFAATTAAAIAQTPAPAAPADAMKSDSKAATKAQKKAAKTEQLKQQGSAMQAESKSSASGAVKTDPTMKPDKVMRTGDKKKDFANAQKSLTEKSDNAPAPAAAVDKSAPKLTASEKKAISKDVGKGSKP
jgi:hypothetical protein